MHQQHTQSRSSARVREDQRRPASALCTHRSHTLSIVGLGVWSVTSCCRRPCSSCICGRCPTCPSLSACDAAVLTNRRQHLRRDLLHTTHRVHLHYRWAVLLVPRKHRHGLLSEQPQSHLHQRACARVVLAVAERVARPAHVARVRRRGSPQGIVIRHRARRARVAPGDAVGHCSVVKLLPRHTHMSRTRWRAAGQEGRCHDSCARSTECDADAGCLAGEQLMHVCVAGSRACKSGLPTRCNARNAPSSTRRGAAACLCAPGCLEAPPPASRGSGTHRSGTPACARRPGRCIRIGVGSTRASGASKAQRDAMHDARD